jgi:hypothetical protein
VRREDLWRGVVGLCGMSDSSSATGVGGALREPFMERAGAAVDAGRVSDAEEGAGGPGAVAVRHALPRRHEAESSSTEGRVDASKYRVVGRRDEVLVRVGGEVDGKPFEVRDCVRCTVLLLDHSEQVVLEGCRWCRVAVMACSSSVFMRSCQHCDVVFCARQVRLRDCSHVRLGLFVESRPVVEDCHSLGVSACRLTYFDHARHLEEARLDLWSGARWSQLHDFSASSSLRHWRVLPPAEQGAATLLLPSPPSSSPASSSGPPSPSPFGPAIPTSLREEQGLGEWFKILSEETQGTHPTMEVDYAVYADGEALLGWLNATITLKAEDEFDANAFLKLYAAEIQTLLQRDSAEVAHLKMTFSPDDGIAGEIASVNLVRSDNTPESGMMLDEPTSGGQLILNLRAEGDPEQLLAAVNAALASAALSFEGLTATLDHEEHFRPGKPVPTHRDGTGEADCTPSQACC